MMLFDVCPFFLVEKKYKCEILCRNERFVIHEVACSTYSKRLKNQGNVMKLLYSTACIAVVLSTHLHAAIQPLSDEQMALQTAQALLSLNFTAPTGSGTGATTTDFGFYKLGIQGVINLNANIKSLKLGCDGLNGTGACDIDGVNVSFGCITNATGICIPVSGTNTNTGVSSTATRTGMRDFTLTNPFIQLAIKNPTSASTREFVGMRLGAENSSGPISFGTLASFSGYLTGKVNLELQAQGPVSETDPTPRDARNPSAVAITCGNLTVPCAISNFVSSTRNGGVNFKALRGDSYNGLTFDVVNGLSFGLDDECAASVGISCLAYFDQLAVSFDAVNRTGNPLVVSGSRRTQASIFNLNLGNATNTINGVAQDGAVKAIVSSLAITETSNGFGKALLNGLLPTLSNLVGNKIITQLAQGLNTTEASLNDNSYILPYNLSNFHEADINSNLFGLSFQRQSVQYPGYAQAVDKGWGLYLPDAINLNISNPTVNFVSNITNGQAALGNIIALQPANVNCYGSLSFC
jgi:hypothetical protein